MDEDDTKSLMVCVSGVGVDPVQIPREPHNTAQLFFPLLPNSVQGEVLRGVIASLLEITISSANDIIN